MPDPKVLTVVAPTPLATQPVDGLPPAAPPPASQLQVSTTGAKPTALSRPWRGWVLAGLVILLGGAGGAWYWSAHHAAALPDGIVWGNGRLEADDIDITPKYAGRVLTLLVDEGDLVEPGQIVARMDTRDTEATLLKVEAQQRQAERSLEAASDDAVQHKTEQRLAQQQVDRTKALFQRGFSTHELLDQRQQAVDGNRCRREIG